MRGAVLAVAGLVAVAGCLEDLPTGTCVADLAIDAVHDENRVTLTWGPVPGAAAYVVTRALNGADPVLVGDVPGDLTTFAEDEVPPGVVTYFVAADGAPRGCDGVSAHFGGPPPPPPAGACATGVQAAALDEGGVLLTWDPVADASMYRVHRGVDGGPPEEYALVPAEPPAMFLDDAAATGVTYTYLVTADGPPPPDGACAIAEVTAVPFFHGPVALALGSLATLGAVAMVARRRGP